jgi:HK97 family phage portal protein
MDPALDIDREQVDFNIVTSFGLAGNGYFHIIDRGKNDQPTQIEVMNPSQMRVNRIKGLRLYRLGSDIGPVLPNKDIIHMPWISLADGLVGLNPIEIGAVGFGIPIAMNEYASRYFAQGIHPTGLLSVDKPIKSEDKDRIVQELMTQHGGLAQSHTPIVLDSNAKWMQISVDPQTAQLLEARAFSRAELAGFYGVPAHLIGDTQSSEIYGKGLQEMVMGFALFALKGYSSRLDRMYSSLLPAGYYAKRKVSDLFKTNDQMLGEFVNALRQAAVATPNECRAFLEFPPSKESGADSLWGPINSAHSDFMLMGGGALSAAPAAADTGAASNTPLPSTPKTPGNEVAPAAGGGAQAPILAPNPNPTGPNKGKVGNA